MKQGSQYTCFVLNLSTNGTPTFILDCRTQNILMRFIIFNFYKNAFSAINMSMYCKYFCLKFLAFIVLLSSDISNKHLVINRCQWLLGILHFLAYVMSRFNTRLMFQTYNFRDIMYCKNIPSYCHVEIISFLVRVIYAYKSSVFSWDIGKQFRPRSDAAQRGDWSGS